MPAVNLSNASSHLGIHLDFRLRDPEPPTEAQRLLIHPKLTPEVEHLGQGDFDMVTIYEAICICHLRALIKSHFSLRI